MIIQTHWIKPTLKANINIFPGQTNCSQRKIRSRGRVRHVDNMKLYWKGRMFVYLLCLGIKKQSVKIFSLLSSTKTTHCTFKALWHSAYDDDDDEKKYCFYFIVSAVIILLYCKYCSFASSIIKWSELQQKGRVCHRVLSSSSLNMRKRLLHFDADVTNV